MSKNWTAVTRADGYTVAYQALSMFPFRVYAPGVSPEHRQYPDLLSLDQIDMTETLWGARRAVAKHKRMLRKLDKFKREGGPK